MKNVIKMCVLVLFAAPNALWGASTSRYQAGQECKKTADVRKHPMGSQVRLEALKKCLKDKGFELPH